MRVRRLFVFAALACAVGVVGVVGAVILAMPRILVPDAHITTTQTAYEQSATLIH
jgi:hypothetical protein